jgi:16S rRNA (guanine966-N2)-methyltransferase
VAVPHANRVRIIGGAFGGRVVRFPPASRLRPTPDRVRETLFNWLGQALTGRRCLDLYAGSGALSLEAASRGAELVVAVDTSRTLIEALRSTASRFGAQAIETHLGDARSFLQAERRAFDVIFADPPFDDDPWPWLLPAALLRLAPGGYLYAEARTVMEAPPGLLDWRRDRAGQVHYHLFARPGPAA